MKKLFLTVLISIFTIGISVAQDLETATNLYNAGATALQEGKNKEALEQFEKALQTASALGEEGEVITKDCKDIIPKLYLSIGKDYAQANDLDNSIANFKKAIEKSKEFSNNKETIAEAKTLIPQILMARAGTFLNNKQFAEAALTYKKITDADPENGTAFLRMGMAYAADGNNDAAIEALNNAAKNGEEENANKQLSNIYLKKAVSCQKEKDLKGALEAAQQSASYNDNANAQKLIGISALSLKQNKIAAEAFEAYLAMQPNASDKTQIIYQLGTALIAVGDTGKACGYFKQIAQDPKFGEAARYQITVLKCN